VERLPWQIFVRGISANNRGDDEEAVFSSSEDRIRASQASAAVLGPSIVSRASSSAPPGPVLPPSWWNRIRTTQVAESLFSVLFPSDCRLCGEPLLNISRLPVCPECVGNVHPIRGKVCSICGERVLSSYAESDADGLLRCPVCRRVERPFVRAVAYGSYDGGLRELVHLLKYNGVRPAAAVLGRMLAQALPALETAFAEARFAQGMFDDARVLVVPVPLHQSKRRQRGFNQSELIARAALKSDSGAVRERLQLAPDLLARTRETESQIGLTSHQRRENLRGAFAVTRAAEVTGRDVLLVDDVYTTGTTATECARVLRRAKARNVWVATVARTLKLASNYAEIGPGFNASTLHGLEGSADPVEPSRLEVLKL
jgi:ComF family protein